MSKLAVWSIEEEPGGNDAGLAEPKRVERRPAEPKRVERRPAEPKRVERRPAEPKRVERRPSVGLEKHLEDWIVKDVSLIGEGLTLVGRQVFIDDGKLDLLAIDKRDRWVVIELKAGMLWSDAVTQALYYASSLAKLDADDLKEKLEKDKGKGKDKSRLAALGNEEKLSEKISRHLESEGEEREIALMLVGAGLSAGVERMREFLGRFGIPIEIVSFEVFKPDKSPKLLIREVIEESDQPLRSKRKYTVEAVRELARKAGVVEQLDRFMKMAEQAGLAVQPQMTSIRIAPPKDKRWLLLFAEPQAGAKRGAGGKLHFYWEPDSFRTFYGIDDQEVENGLGKLNADRSPAGKEINNWLDRIEKFLNKHFPRAHAHDN